MDVVQHNHSPQKSGVLRNEIQMIRGIMQRVMPLVNGQHAPGDSAED